MQVNEKRNDRINLVILQDPYNNKQLKFPTEKVNTISNLTSSVLFLGYNKASPTYGQLLIH